MKLYLSSYRLPDAQALFDLVGKQPNEIRAVIVPNAKDYYADRARAIKIQSVADYLRDFDMQTTVLDLRLYSGSAEIVVALSDIDLIWIMGGNTFCLMHEIRRSGFDTALPKLLGSGVVYAGESAGAVVAGTSLKGIEYADAPEFAESVIWDGLGLVPYFVLPHAGDGHFLESTEKCRSMYADSERLELTNEQAALFEGSDCRIIDAVS